MGKHARRAMAGTPIVFGNPNTLTTTTTNSYGADTVIGYQCTCYRRRCRCGASGVRVLDANSMVPTRMMAMNQTYNSGCGYGYGYGYGRSYCGGGRRRRQGPITALVGGLINLAIEKHGEKKAAREAAADDEQRRSQPIVREREVEEVDDSSESEYEVDGPQTQTQTQGVETRRPEIRERSSSSKKGEKNKLRKPAVQFQHQTSEQVHRSSENPRDTAPPPYSA